MTLANAYKSHSKDGRICQKNLATVKSIVLNKKPQKCLNVIKVQKELITILVLSQGLISL